jgi:AcrR family transcriptional regulator
VTKIDRRVERTREILRKSLLDLMSEREYDAITIQDIVNRANIGRTTFYLHYKSKDELFMSCHESMVREFRVGLLHPHSQDELLSPEIPAGLKSAYRHLEESRAMLYSVFQGKDGLLRLRQLRDWNAHQIEANLRVAFAEVESSIPLDVLSTYLAGAQITLLHWWLEKRRPHTLQELGQTFHRLQRAAILDAFGLEDR